MECNAVNLPGAQDGAMAAVAQGVERVVADSNPSSPSLSWAACWSVLEQDNEPKIAPDVQLAPCMAASAISVWLCVWMGECGKYCKALWVVSRLEKLYIIASPQYLYCYNIVF